MVHFKVPAEPPARSGRVCAFSWWSLSFIGAHRRLSRQFAIGGKLSMPQGRGRCQGEPAAGRTCRGGEARRNACGSQRPAHPKSMERIVSETGSKRTRQSSRRFACRPARPRSGLRGSHPSDRLQRSATPCSIALFLFIHSGRPCNSSTGAAEFATLREGIVRATRFQRSRQWPSIHTYPPGRGAQ